LTYFVIAGLDPAIQSNGTGHDLQPWMPGSSPGMTSLGIRKTGSSFPW
jgi:hypothetical protein